MVDLGEGNGASSARRPAPAAAPNDYPPECRASGGPPAHPTAAARSAPAKLRAAPLQPPSLTAAASLADFYDNMSKEQLDAMRKRADTSAAVQRLQYSEATMPGDVGDLATVGTGEGLGIWERMAMVIRNRSLDVRILMDAHDRRNYGFVDIPTFRRSLCYAFGERGPMPASLVTASRAAAGRVYPPRACPPRAGNQWIDLAMTSAELKEISAPYLSRKPNAKGEPEAFVMWQKFTTDLQHLADNKEPTQEFLSRLAEIEAREKASAELMKEYGVTEFELKSALAAIKDRLLTYNRTIVDAFRRIDADHSGTLRADEIKAFFQDAYLGDIVNDRTLNAIVDMSDADGDDQINYKELTKVITAEDVLELQSLVKDRKKVSASKLEGMQTVGSRGTTVAELKAAQQAIKTKLMEKHSTVRAALRDFDEDGSGVLSRDEIYAVLNTYYLLEYKDFYTGETRGDISYAACDTLLDFIDKSGDGKIDQQEFAKVLLVDDIMTMANSGANTSIFSYKTGKAS